MPYLYDDPETMSYVIIDEAIRELIKEMNETSWLTTEESCSGHPVGDKAATGSAWPGYADLYLRLIVRERHIPKLLLYVDRIRESYGHQPMWSLSLVYDRMDDLGFHWYLTFNYGRKLSNRDIAVGLLRRRLEEIELMK